MTGASTWVCMSRWGAKVSTGQGHSSEYSSKQTGKLCPTVKIASLLAVSHEAMCSLAQCFLGPIEEEDDWTCQLDFWVGYQHTSCLQHNAYRRCTIRSTCSRKLNFRMMFWKFGGQLAAQAIPQQTASSLQESCTT